MEFRRQVAHVKRLGKRPQLQQLQEVEALKPTDGDK